METLRELELYVHIPFCVKKCAYCDFLSAPAELPVQEAYTEALKREIQSFSCSEEYRVTTVFFGGGTPSVLSEKSICEVMDLLRSKFHFVEGAEVSIECNPGTANGEKLRAYCTAGINRLSIGLQSANDKELLLLGRMHTWEDFCRTYEAARANGFGNINVDLMSALPGQTARSWEETLHRVLNKKPEHISAYSLIIEEGTIFYRRYHEDARKRDAGETPEFLPSEEDERQMYELTRELLSRAGMHRYEISNYALPGYECRHNIGYWQGREYLGLGLGASSLLGHTRYRNPENLADYLAGDFSGTWQETLTREEQMEEFMFLGLRMMCGVSELAFETKFGKSMEKVYGTVLKRQQKLGMLEKSGDRLYLTPRGIDLSNAVMAEFLL